MSACRFAAVLACVFLGGSALAADEGLSPKAAGVPASVQAQIEQLRSSDPVMRIVAARKLRMMGEQAAAAAPALVAMLDDSTQATVGREASTSTCGAEAAFALGDLGRAGRDALLGALKDSRAEVRARAAQGLGGMKKDRRAIDPLIAALKDEAPLVRAMAASSLGDFNHDISMGTAPPGREQARIQEALLAALDDPEWQVRERAAMGFMFAGNDRALQTLEAGLHHVDPAIRADAAQSLQFLGDQRAVDPLIAALKDIDPGVRGAAALTLGRLKGSLSEVSQPEPWNPQAKRWQDPDPRAVEALVVRALGDTRDSRALGPLIGATKDKDRGVAASAVNALGWLGDAAAVPVLVESLRHEDPVVRTMAAQGLRMLQFRIHGEAAPPGAVDALLAALGDTDPHVRGAAADTLGWFRDPRAVEPLMAILQADPAAFPRDRAAVALGNLADSRAIDPLAAALQDEDLRVRRMAALALGRFADESSPGGRRAVEALIDALRDGDAQVRGSVALSLARSGDRRAVKPLQALLNDEDEIVRRDAASALSGLHGPGMEAAARGLDSEDAYVREMSIHGVIGAGGSKAVEALIVALRDQNESVRNSALNAAFHPERAGRAPLKDPRLVEPLIAALKDESLSVKIGAILGLVVQEDTRAVDPLIAALKDEEPPVRAWAAVGLGVLKDPRSVAPLVELLKDEDAETRVMAASALGGFKDPSTVEPLLTALQDPQQQVRERAAASLGEVKDPRSEPALIGALKDTAMEVRCSAAVALGSLGTPGAIDALLAAAADRTLPPKERASAVTGLGESKDPRAVEHLLAALRDPEPEVRRGAARPLGRLRETRAVEPLIALLADEDEMVRGAAFCALVEITGQAFEWDAAAWEQWWEENKETVVRGQL